MRFTKLVSSVRFLHRRIYDGRNGTRTYCAPAPEVGGTQKKCCVICCYEQNNQLELTPRAAELDQKCGGKISQQLNTYVCDLHLGKAFAITGILDYSAVAIASIGPKNAGYNELESLDEARENIRWGVGAGVRLLKERGAVDVEVDPCSAPDAAAEAAELAAWRFEVFKSAEGRKPSCHVSELGDGGADSQLWLEGAIRGRAQNWARCLSDMPANKMTPVDLAQCALDRLCPLGVEVEAHDRDWVEAQGMRAFLAVARGSCDTPMFLHCDYRGAGPATPPVLLAAKGVTFDSGGMCLKECQSMTENRGSMAGAAVVLAAFEIIAKLKLPINVTGVIPICENMVSGQCMKVGDVVQALNGMSIQIENTDMEGRLMMADALVYGQSLYKPSLVIDVATFTHGVLMATGGGAFGCFSNCEGAWRAAHCAGAASGDRPWRFPLWRYFHTQLTNDPSVDLRNQGSGRATPCLGAAFLKNFICGDWLHMDITGVGKVAHSGAPPYLDTRRMTGRPTRTLAVLLQHLATPPCTPTSPQGPRPGTPVYPTDPKPCPPVGSPIDTKPCPPIGSPIDPKPCPPVYSPIDPKPYPPVCRPTDPKPYPPLGSPTDPKPYPPVGSPIDPKSCPPVCRQTDPKPCPPDWYPTVPKPYAPVCRPTDPKPYPPVGSPTDPKPYPPVCRPIDPKPYPPFGSPTDPKPYPPVGSPIDPKSYPPVCRPTHPKPCPPDWRPTDPKPCPPDWRPTDPKPYAPVCRPTDPKPYPPVGSPTDPKPYPPVCRPTDPKSYPPFGSPTNPKPYPPVGRDWYPTDPKPYPPVGSPTDPKPYPPVCHPTDPKPYPPVGSPTDPKPYPPVCRPTDPKPYPPVCSPTDPKPYPPVGSPTDPKPYPPVCSPTDPKPYPPVGSPTDPKPYPPVCRPTDPKSYPPVDSPPVCCPPAPTCAPKPQICPPSTETCSPNPQTCVPPMKHKCN